MWRRIVGLGDVVVLGVCVSYHGYLMIGLFGYSSQHSPLPGPAELQYSTRSGATRAHGRRPDSVATTHLDHVPPLAHCRFRSKQSHEQLSREKAERTCEHLPIICAIGRACLLLLSIAGSEVACTAQMPEKNPST